MKKVLFAAFESLPFVKTGGLADVVGALPKAINPLKYDVRVVIPYYKSIKEKYESGFTLIDHICVNSGVMNEEGNIYEYETGGIIYYFIENDHYFYRDSIYGYDDDVNRFVFFNVAVIEMMIKMNYYPDIIHTHDYHTAVIPALCKLRYKENKKIKDIKHVFTIHNLAFQGFYSKSVLFDLLGFEYRYFEDGSLRFNDGCNFMKIGIVFSDKITTVSESYAKEIVSCEAGENLDAVLSYRKEDLSGIVNGIDYDIFNPSKDDIFYNYSLRNYLKGKAANKKSLQYELGLYENPDCLLVGMISRLTWQKGIEIFLDSIDRLLLKNVQIAILGSGESRYEYRLKTMENDHRHNAVFYCGYNEKLAHQMYAGLDMIVMPSLFEPCGISQLISMHYGTVPFVRETGGLKDTVIPFNEYTKEGNGFSFTYFDSGDFMHVFDYAFDQFENHKENWKLIIKSGMKTDVSFDTSAKGYEKLYESL